MAPPAHPGTTGLSSIEWANEKKVFLTQIIFNENGEKVHKSSLQKKLSVKMYFKKK